MNEYGALMEWYWQRKEEYSYSPTLSGTNATFTALGSTLNFRSEWSICEDVSYDTAQGMKFLSNDTSIFIAYLTLNTLLLQ